MKNAFFNFRLWMHRLRKQYSPKARRTRPIREGLPEGVERSVLETICAENFHCSIASVAYIHLSGWKSAGAYRLIIRSAKGKDVFLIYKNAYYTTETIPALKELPVWPGPPEFEIYRQSAGVLSNYLPRVYYVDETSVGTHYRYILEDLHQEYRLIKGDLEKIHFSQKLPELHRALSEWATQRETSHLITYGKQFSEALQQYALQNFETLYRESPGSNLKSILDQWPKISQIHLQPEFFQRQAQVIHGDANFSNIHIHRSDESQFKLVDWEWAGFGSPYADLVALMKGALDNVERQSFHQFLHFSFFNNDGRSPKDEYRDYLWCKLERCMLDAAFLSSQFINSPIETHINVEAAIKQALHRMLLVYQQLA